MEVANEKEFGAKLPAENLPAYMEIFGDSTEQQDCFRRSFEWLAKYLKP